MLISNKEILGKKKGLGLPFKKKQRAIFAKKVYKTSKSAYILLASLVMLGAVTNYQEKVDEITDQTIVKVLDVVAEGKQDIDEILDDVSAQYNETLDDVKSMAGMRQVYSLSGLVEVLKEDRTQINIDDINFSIDLIAQSPDLEQMDKELVLEVLESIGEVSEDNIGDALVKLESLNRLFMHQSGIESYLSGKYPDLDWSNYTAALEQARLIEAADTDIDTVKWNHKIIPTWDKGRVGNFDILNKITQACLEKGVNKFHYFVVGSSMFTDEVQSALGVVSDYDLKMPRVKKETRVSLKLKDGPQSLRPNLKQYMLDNNIYHISGLINPEVKKELLELKHSLPKEVKLSDVIGYHSMVHYLGPYLDELSEDEIIEDLSFFQDLIREAFDAPEFVLKSGRPPYGAGFFSINRERGYINGGFVNNEGTKKMLRVQERFSELNGVPFEWKLWRTGTNEFFTKGYFNIRNTVKSAHHHVHPKKGFDWDKGPNHIILHAAFYHEKVDHIKKLLSSLDK